MTSNEITRLQRDHAAERVRELQAQSAVDSAQENAARALEALEAAGGEPIDTGLPENASEAAAELERRAYELTAPARREMDA